MGNPNRTTLPPPTSRIWLAAFFVWTLLAVLSFGQGLAFGAYQGVQVPPQVQLLRLAVSLADWWTCGIWTPAIYWMVRRFPIRSNGWKTGVPAHVLASAAFIVAKISLYLPIFNLLTGSNQSFPGMVVRSGYYDLLGYWGATVVIHAIEYYREAQQRSIAAAKLDGELRAAELENLRAQLHPHFLFNTLQAISTLIHRDPAAADRMLTDLSDLLRISLRHSAAQEVPLRDELSFLTRYLDIMRVRFGDRLAIDVDVSPDLLDARVPSLVLQPLAENAIRHGMADRQDRGRVAVRGWRDGDSLLLEVADDGAGLSPGAHAEGNGIGLANTRERLSRLYGTGHSLWVGAPAQGEGTVVRLTIPYRS